MFSLKDSLHGREILAVCGIRIPGIDRVMLLSGSEDSFLKVSQMQRDGTGFKVV